MRICFSHSLESFELQLTENRSKRGGVLRFVVCEMPRADLLHFFKVGIGHILSIASIVLRGVASIGTGL